MSFNATYVAADPSFVPVAGDLERVVDFLRAGGTIGDPISDGVPVMGEEFRWKPGANASAAVEGQGYQVPAGELSKVTLYMDTEPMPVGDDGGLAFETRFYLRFYEAAEPRDEFIETLGRLIGARMFGWIGHY